MRLVVITPVGPGHQGCINAARASVRTAQLRPGRFTSVRHVVVDDGHGDLGRSRARNAGMDESADWYFFLDADDSMQPDALEALPAGCPVQAAFGSIALRGGPRRTGDVQPCGWREVALHGATGTLSMGFFCRADVARRLRFNETMDAGEDFDFYLRLDSFIKLDRPLVDIGYDLPSAGGPRGYVEIDWIGICNELIVAAVAREPVKYDLRGDAVLAKAGYLGTQSQGLSRSLFA